MAAIGEPVEVVEVSEPTVPYEGEEVSPDTPTEQPTPAREEVGQP